MMTNRAEFPPAPQRRVPESLLLATFAAWAPPAPARVITIAPKLRIGDALRLQITHTRLLLSGGVQDVKAQMSVEVEVTAVSAQAGSFQCWPEALTQQVQTYFGLNGMSLRVGEPHEADVPNPFDGTVGPARYRITADSLSDDTAVLRTSTTFDRSLLGSTLRAMVAKRRPPMLDEPVADLASVEMSDEGRYVLDRMRGLMRQVVVTRRVSAAALQQVERWDIRLMQAPKR